MDATAASSANLLLVDDDPTLLQALSSLLGDFPHLRFAVSAADALRMTDESVPDLVVLDAEMPGMSGLELLATMRRQPQLASLPVLLLTSHDKALIEARAAQLGVVAFLTKPVEPATFRTALMSALDHRPVAAQPRSEEPVRVLIVADATADYEEVLDALSPMAGWIQRCDSAAQAQKLAWTNDPDVVVLVAGTRGVDEFALIQAFKADPGLEHVAIVVLKRGGGVDHEAALLEAGAADFQSLPFSARVLRARVAGLAAVKHRLSADLQSIRPRS